VKRKRFDFEKEKDKELAKKLKNDFEFAKKELKEFEYFVGNLGYSATKECLYYFVNRHGGLGIGTTKNHHYIKFKYYYLYDRYESNENNILFNAGLIKNTSGKVSHKEMARGRGILKSNRSRYER